MLDIGLTLAVLKYADDWYNFALCFDLKVLNSPDRL